jgi:TatD DNase family protein
MIDTHAHLSTSPFDGDRDEVIARAFAVGVAVIVEVGIDLDLSRSAVDLARRHERIAASVGIHPHDAGRHDVADVDSLDALLAAGRCVAVGETGLDFFRDYAPRDRQEALFRRHIELARRHDLPLIVHSRGAEARVVEILEETDARAVGGVLHCYGGPADLVPRAVEAGFYFGFGGSVTRSRGRHAELLPRVPIDRCLLETDCPYLAPAPKTSRRNEPAFLCEVVPVMSELMGVPERRLVETTDANARRLFHLPL